MCADRMSSEEGGGVLLWAVGRSGPWLSHTASSVKAEQLGGSG